MKALQGIHSLIQQYHLFPFPAASPTPRCPSPCTASTWPSAPTASGRQAAALGATACPRACRTCLAALRAAGLNHLHLLPTYDLATVPEREEEQKKLDWVRGALGVRFGVCCGRGFGLRGSVPEGSYATDPDGIARWVFARVACGVWRVPVSCGRVCLLVQRLVVVFLACAKPTYNWILCASVASGDGRLAAKRLSPDLPITPPTTSIRELGEMVQALHG